MHDTQSNQDLNDMQRNNKNSIIQLTSHRVLTDLAVGARVAGGARAAAARARAAVTTDVTVSRADRRVAQSCHRVAPVALVRARAHVAS